MLTYYIGVVTGRLFVFLRVRTQSRTVLALHEHTPGQMFFSQLAHMHTHVQSNAHTRLSH